MILVPGREHVIKLLIQKGANINSLTNKEWPPIILASNKGHENAVKVLLENGANPNVIGDNGWSPLHFAAYYGNF